jgi:hypothetical protein
MEPLILSPDDEMVGGSSFPSAEYVILGVYLLLPDFSG